ncbi:MAG TPA: hypothetical protein VIZ68_00390, partial [Thermoplasmata archaeon]
FYLGAVLAMIGGALIAAIRSSEVQERRRSGRFAESLGPPCPSCGHRIPTWTSKCPYCGSP